jgi:hypothetical protein
MRPQRHEDQANANRQTTHKAAQGKMRNSRLRLTKHVRAHEAVIAEEYWYGDGPPLMHPSLLASNTAKRRADVVGIPLKAKKSKALGDRNRVRLLKRLANKIDRYRHGSRCGFETDQNFSPRLR